METYKILITIDSRSWFVNDSEGLPREWEDKTKCEKYKAHLESKHPNWVFKIV